MAYTINLSDGSTFATVTDGTINTDSSLTVIGRNYAGYGEFLGENFMKLLENSANTSAPSTPLIGQMWYDKTNNVLKVYNGSLWREIGSSNSGTSAPPSPTEGDMWFDSTNDQLKVYNGTSWLVVGPSYTAGSGISGAIVEIITDNATNDHTIVKIYVEDTVVGIWSTDAEFTPNVAMSGFTTVKPGMQVSSTVSGALLYGTATNSQLLDSLDSTQFLRSDANDTTSGSLSVLNDTGLSVGADSDLSIAVTGTDVIIKNITSNGDLLLSVNDGGVQTTVITLDGATGKGLINADPTANLGIATKQYVDAATSSGGAGSFSTVTTTGTASIGTNLTVMGTSTLTSDVTIGGNLTVSGTTTTINTETINLADNIVLINSNEAGTPSQNGGIEIERGTATNKTFLWDETNDNWTVGSETIVAGIFSGTASQAQYADLAERFEADGVYMPGTLVSIGGSKEITKCIDELSDDVFGVVSTQPAYLMNSKSGDDATHPPIALSGRVVVTVAGGVKKGDRLVSAGDGHARAGTVDEINSFNVIGRALEDKITNGIGTIEAFVRIN